MDNEIRNLTPAQIETLKREIIELIDKPVTLNDPMAIYDIGEKLRIFFSPEVTRQRNELGISDRVYNTAHTIYEWAEERGNEFIAGVCIKIYQQQQKRSVFSAPKAETRDLRPS
ncbi:MAG: hypothetical protein WBK55_02000 [Alphaproteobacteria bacterium]